MNRQFFGDWKPDLFLDFMSGDFPNGLTLLDTTGLLAPQLADRIPKHHTRRVIYLDPSDLAHPFCGNFFKGVEPDKRHSFAEAVCNVFDAVFPEGASTLTRAKANFALLTILTILLYSRRSTFMSVLKFLSDMSFRKKSLTKCTDAVVLANWDTIAKDEGALQLLTTKVGTLLASPAMRNILGQHRNSLGKCSIVIADLNRAKIGDSAAKLFAWLLIARTTNPVYIPDLGFFSTDHIVSLLPQERFTLAVRSLSELTPKLRDAVLNIDHKYVYKTNPKDAKELAYYVGQANPRNLIEAEPGEVFSSKRSVIPTCPPPGRRLKPIRKRTRACCTAPRAQVEAAIADFFAV